MSEEAVTTMAWKRYATSAIGACGLLIAATVSGPAQPNPWTPERMSALVRVEVPQARGPFVGTGFVVRGLGGRSFVLTATHVLLPEHDPGQSSAASCSPLLAGTRLRQGNSGGAELVANCAYRLGSDISLIELAPRDGGYPVLALSARDLVNGDAVLLAGFPFGYPREVRAGKVTQTTGPAETLVTDILTAEGMSGGPYLDQDGMVVGIHRGGGRYTAGFAHMTPIWRLRTYLEQYLPAISTRSSGFAPAEESDGAAQGGARALAAIRGRRATLSDDDHVGTNAYSFRRGRVVSSDDPAADFRVWALEPWMGITVPLSLVPLYDADDPYRDQRLPPAHAGVAHAPLQNLNNVDDCRSVRNYRPGPFPLEHTRIYCIRGRDGISLAKIGIVDLTTNRVSFDWIYQPAE
jgi:Trypsin-like peptidase domain